MSRSDRIGFWVSGTAHGAVLIWAIIGGNLFAARPAPPLQMAEVTTISEAEFDALAARSRGAGPVGQADGQAPVQPEAPGDTTAPAAPELSQPAPSAPPEVATLAPPAAEDAPDLSQLDAPTAPPVEVATVAPLPEPAPQPQPQVTPPASDSAPPALPDAPSPLDAPPSPADTAPPRSALALDDSPAPRLRPDGLVEANRAAEAARIEAERQAELAAEQAEAERIAAAEAEAERAEAERLEQERLAEEQRLAEQLAREAAERARLEQERLEQERIEAERRLAEERAEQQRLEQERIEAERRLAEERAAQERLEQERAERERAEQERLEAERRIAEEQERLERERREAAEIAAAMDREIARIAEQDRAQQAARNAQEATPSPVDGNAPEGMGEGGGSDILTDALNEAIGSDIMDDALSAALADATGRPRAADIVRGDPRVVAAVPLTEQERVEFARAVNECWRMQQLSPEVAAVRMTLRFDMFPDGLPDPDSFVPAASSTTEAVTLQQAFEAGRRAVMHCARNGYDLPADKYAAWQMVELTFSSSGVEAN